MCVCVCNRTKEPRLQTAIVTLNPQIILDKHKLGDKVCNIAPMPAPTPSSSPPLPPPQRHNISLKPLFPFLFQDRKAQNAKWLKKWKAACFIVSLLYFILKFL